MKRIISIMTALLIVISLTGCGGNNTPADTGNTNFELVNKQFGDVAINVPNSFSEVKEVDGSYASSTTNTSIVVTPLAEVELSPTEWDEQLAIDSLDLFFTGVYDNMELVAFEGNINMNGTPAVYYSFYGTPADGIERLVHSVRLFNADITEQYLIMFLHLADDETYNADISLNIINSITLTK